MLNYLKKFTLEILPSVAATIIGAYIVNHYINRPAADAPVAAAVSPAEVKKSDVKPADGATSDATGVPEHGVTAKGISERAMIEKSASERPGEFKPSEAKPSEAKPSEAKPSEAKPSESKPSETASLPAAKRPTPPAPPKAVAKTTPAPAASPAAPVETASVPAEDHRDANDLARAAIERLRKEDGQSHPQEASRAPDAPHLQDAPRTVVPPPAVSTASVRPLPPPITVVAPPVEGQGNNQANNQGNPAPYTASINADNPNRLVPPADIPPPPPMDLRAGADRLATRTNNMAQDVLAKTKSMFHSLLPGGSNGDSGGGQGQSSSASQFTD
jgi:hypothetical protein